MPETRNDTAVTWAAMSAAVALLTARRAGAGDRQADVIGDVPPGQVIAALGNHRRWCTRGANLMPPRDLPVSAIA